MLKPTFYNILLCFLLKYIAFYVFLMFKNNNFYFLTPNIRSLEDLVYYLWSFLSLPVINMVLFALPIYYIFKQQNITYFTIIIVIFLIAEYFIYTYLASRADLINGIYNGILSLLCLLLFFYRHIKNFRMNIG